MNLDYTEVPLSQFGDDQVVSVLIDEGQRQMIILAMAKLAKERPGWEDCLRMTSKKFGQDGEAMFMWFLALDAEDIVSKLGSVG